MKATIEFDLPEENYEYRMFNHASDMYGALFDISNLVREIDKGWVDLDVEKLSERIKYILIDSKIYEIE